MAIASNGLVSPEQALEIISKAWGRQRGYCFFPWISGTAETQKERIKSYREGQAFYWPKDKQKIIDHLNAHVNEDCYWCPSLFESRQRKMENAMDEHCLWADLDEVDPNDIKDYPPTVAWETSPGRFQALWILNAGDIQGASWPGKENQRMTYYLGADQAGWDTTQLLRLPGWKNHKPAYRQANKGRPVQGRLLWKNGRRYLSDDFEDLPEIESLAGYVDDVVEDQIAHTDRHEVWARVRLKVSKRVREYVLARSTSGNRSEVLWQIERELADAGCSVVEIVAIVQATVWNKFSGRSDELRRLTIEAAKAINERSEETKDQALEELEAKPDPINLFDYVENLKDPRWLVKGVFTEGCVGFIAAEPKTYKSWLGLDLALSIASGSPFLGTFSIIEPGPVLYIQEEDSGPTIKRRLGKVWERKNQMTISGDGNGGLFMGPPEHTEGRPDIDCYVGKTFILSDESWQVWLDEQLSKKAYRFVIIDPLMMVMGEVEENKSQDMMNKVLRPLKTLARKYNVTIILVHHLKKGGQGTNLVRGGQMMLGSVALHAWSEDAIFIRRNKSGTLNVEQESKSAPVTGFTIWNVKGFGWDPQVKINDDEESAEDELKPRRQAKAFPHKVNRSLTTLKAQKTPKSVMEIATLANISRQSVNNTMVQALAEGLVTKVGSKYQWKGTN